MTRIVSTALIARTPASVFSYITTPAYWPDWHPSSLAVSGATDHPLALGEQVTERYRVAGQEGTVNWTVSARDEPRRWTISGTIAGGAGASGTVSYMLAASGDQTRFERVFEYSTPPDPALAQAYAQQVQAESDEAVRHLKARLETA